MTHPEELLAAYVDGTLSDPERAEVDAHLASCATCRDEVELAGRARAALAALPVLDVPPNTVRPGVTRLPARSGDRFRRTRWVAGLAAAAAIAAIFGMIVLSNGTGGGGGLAAGSPTPGDEGLFSGAHIVHQPHSDYDRARLRTLAGTLSTELAKHEARRTSENAPEASGAGAGAAGTAAGTAPQPSSASDQATLASGSSYSVAALDPASCLRRGAGLAHGTRPVKVIVARFQGTPAYIGAFVIDGGTPETLVLYVVARGDCRQLSSLQQAIR